MKPAERKRVLRRIELLKTRALLHALNGQHRKAQTDLNEAEKLTKKL